MAPDRRRIVNGARATAPDFDTVFRPPYFRPTASVRARPELDFIIIGHYNIEFGNPKTRALALTLSSERLAVRQRHLVEVAQALIRERGDAGFSMTLLAERAGVSAATPYNLLGSKSEILRRVVRDDIARFVGELAEHTGATPLDSLLIAADRLVHHYERDHQFHVGLFRAAFSTDVPEVRGILSAESWAWWKNLVDAAMQSRELASFVRPKQLTDALLRMMGAVAQTWLTEDWPGDRFALEMSASVRLVLASVTAPRRRNAMIEEIASLQAAIDALLGRGKVEPEKSASVDSA